MDARVERVWARADKIWRRESVGEMKGARVDGVWTRGRARFDEVWVR